ncbi:MULTISPECIES: ABC transporter permease [Cohnella]|uniref:ABC transporter permease n=1 Tax=Cohnella TaxID=329857 RepID=UPI0009BB6D9E|nr:MULTISPECIES: ABC transporter permease [Cohnella]MBN2981414.1 ABC transporter permease [Cohnella algarum]
MVLWVLARSMVQSRLQYSVSHAVRTAASVIFGMIYAAIWQGIGEQDSLGDFGTEGMVAYIAFNQVILWLTFTNYGLGLAERVRTGQIALDLARPLHLFAFAAGREAGSMAYNALFTALPLYFIYFWIYDLSIPRDPAVWLWTAAALLMAVYAALCIAYAIGLASLWTVEGYWLHMLNYSVNFVLSGFLIPIQWMPEWLQTVAGFSPYPIFHSIPTQLYLGKTGPGTLLVPLLWCALLTAGALAATKAVKRKVEVQGG